MLRGVILDLILLQIKVTGSSVSSDRVGASMTKGKVIMLLGLLLLGLDVQAKELVVPSSTTIPFSFLENKKASVVKEGSQIPIQISEDVLVQDQGIDRLIFKKGQAGYAEVFWAMAPRHYATPGRLYIRYVYLSDVTGQERKLILDLKKLPKRNPLTIVVPLAAVPIVWLFKGQDPEVYDSTNPNENHFQARVFQPFVVDIDTVGQTAVENLAGNVEKGLEPENESLLSNPEAVILLTKVCDRVRQNWQPPLLKGKFSGKVEYQIDEEGKLSQVMLQGTTGNKKLDLSMIKAVESSAPFPETVDFIKRNSMPIIRVKQGFSYSLE